MTIIQNSDALSFKSFSKGSKQLEKLVQGFSLSSKTEAFINFKYVKGIDKPVSGAIQEYLTRFWNAENRSNPSLLAAVLSTWFKVLSELAQKNTTEPKIRESLKNIDFHANIKLFIAHTNFWDPRCAETFFSYYSLKEYPHTRWVESLYEKILSPFGPITE